MDKLVSVYWFAILFIVAFAIVFMVSSVYNNNYDVRELEANLLSSRVVDCLGEAGVVKDYVFGGDFQDSFLGYCNLNFESEELWEDEQYFVRVDIFEYPNFETNILEISKGNLNLEPMCATFGEEEQNVVGCSNKKVYFTYEEKQFLFNVNSIVRKSEKNADK